MFEATLSVMVKKRKQSRGHPQKDTQLCSRI